jgi:hypothetical protein
VNPFYSDYYELPYTAECPECGTPMHEPRCEVCIEADYMDEMAA